jgi:hypothetical protein
MPVEKMYSLIEGNSLDTSFVWSTLKRAGYEKTEDDLIRAIRENKSKKIVHYAVIGLMEVGTQTSVPTLKGLTHYPNRDVETTAVVAIGKIARGKESLFFGELLDDPRYGDKMYPMTILWEVGTEAALPAVMRFAEKIINNEIKSYADAIDPRYVKGYLEKYRIPETEGIIEQLGPSVANLHFEY